MNAANELTKGQEMELEIIMDAVERLAISKCKDGTEYGCNCAVYAILRMAELQGMHSLSIDAGIADYLLDRAVRQHAELDDGK